MPSTKPKSKCPYCEREFVSVDIHTTLSHKEILDHNNNKQKHPERFVTNPEPIKWSQNNIFCGCVGCRPPTQTPQ